MFRIAWQHFSTAAHIIVALGLLLGSIVFVVRAIRAKAVHYIVPAWVGLFAIVAAGYAGAEFVASQNDTYSLIMSIGFVTAVGAYVWSLV